MKLRTSGIALAHPCRVKSDGRQGSSRRSCNDDAGTGFVRETPGLSCRVMASRAGKQGRNSDRRSVQHIAQKRKRPALPACETEGDKAGYPCRRRLSAAGEPRRLKPEALSSIITERRTSRNGGAFHLSRTNPESRQEAWTYS